MTTVAVHGLVLRLRDLGESDLLVDLFTAQKGRVTALAKGARRSRRRFMGLLVAVHLLEMELAPTKKGGDLFRLEAARLAEHFWGLRQDWRRFLAAGPVVELLLRGVAPLDPHPGALELALNVLERLSRATSPREMASLLVVFLTRLTPELGYGLHLSTCLHCGRPAQSGDGWHLSLAGGAVCPSCPPGRGALPAPLGLIKGLGAALSLEPGALGRLSLPASLLPVALRYLALFWRATLDHDLASLDLAGRVLLK